MLPFQLLPMFRTILAIPRSDRTATRCDPKVAGYSTPAMTNRQDKQQTFCFFGLHAFSNDLAKYAIVLRLEFHMWAIDS